MSKTIAAPAAGSAYSALVHVVRNERPEACGALLHSIAVQMANNGGAINSLRAAQDAMREGKKSIGADTLAGIVLDALEGIAATSEDAGARKGEKAARDAAALAYADAMREGFLARLDKVAKAKAKARKIALKAKADAEAQTKAEGAPDGTPTDLSDALARVTAERDALRAEVQALQAERDTLRNSVNALQAVQRAKVRRTDPAPVGQMADALTAAGVALPLAA